MVSPRTFPLLAANVTHVIVENGNERVPGSHVAVPAGHVLRWTAWDAVGGRAALVKVQ